MHEASIALSVLETVSDLCQQEGYNSIESVRLEYISLGGVCRDCGSNFASEERYIFACPVCKSSAIKITQGDEMQIIDMEVH